MERYESMNKLAVPEVENEVAKEPYVVLLDIDGHAEARGEQGRVV